MKYLQTPTANLVVSLSLILLSSLTFLPNAQRSSRRFRSTAAPIVDTSGSENDYASRAIIGRVNSSGHAAINPRARELINNQNGRGRQDSSLGGYADLNMLDEAFIPTVNCSASCTPREALKRMRVETIKLDILKKLRISTMPNMTNQRVPDIPWVRNMIDGNSQQHDSPYSDGVGSDHDHFALDTEHSTTLRTIIFPTTDALSSFIDHHSQFCRFTLHSRFFHRKEVVSVSFGVYVKRTGSEDITHPVLPGYVFLHRVKSHGVTEVYLKKRIPTWSTEDGHWIQFDIKSVVQEWLARPDTNHGLKVVVTDSQARFTAIVNPNNPDYELHKPFLDVSVRERARSRSRRSATAMTCDERSNERRCCRYPLIIDFEAFRWDWIIAPRSYHAYYCSGECPFTYFQSFTHTHVVQQVRADSRNGGPCCSPRDLSPISLLYFDTNKNIISGLLPGMVVNRCSCS